MNYDTETSYDLIRLEYKDAGNVWQTVGSWSGVDQKPWFIYTRWCRARSPSRDEWCS